jgi:hypothetical protein
MRRARYVFFPVSISHRTKEQSLEPVYAVVSSRDRATQVALSLWPARTWISSSAEWGRRKTFERNGNGFHWKAKSYHVKQEGKHLFLSDIDSTMTMATVSRP